MMNTPLKPETISVIISTYNNPRWLEKTLWGYECQSYKDFDILIADDGSGDETAALIKRFQEEAKLKIKQVWHPDNGFQKCRILNRAILETDSDYLIFTDQDCIPRSDFVACHVSMARPGRFLSGGYFKLPMPISLRITKEDIMYGRAFDLGWLHKQGLGISFKETKLWKYKTYAALLNRITPTRASWNGMNSSCWRRDALLVHGFNVQMQYGGEDREFGERLVNASIRPEQIRYSAVCVHLDHERPYKNKEQMKINKRIRKETKAHKLIQTPTGIYDL